MQLAEIELRGVVLVVAAATVGLVICIAIEVLLARRERARRRRRLEAGRVRLPQFASMTVNVRPIDPQPVTEAEMREVRDRVRLKIEREAARLMQKGPSTLG